MRWHPPRLRSRSVLPCSTALARVRLCHDLGAGRVSMSLHGFWAVGSLQWMLPIHRYEEGTILKGAKHRALPPANSKISVQNFGNSMDATGHLELAFQCVSVKKFFTLDFLHIAILGQFVLHLRRVG
jgi:hypothetical protein